MAKIDLNPSDIEAMREAGKNLEDRGFGEVNLATGQILWKNEFSLQKMGYTLAQVQALTVYDIIPKEFHGALSSSLDDESRGRSQTFSIWPCKAADGKYVWWYVTKVKSAHPIHWYKTEYLNTTANSGPEYAAMFAAMHTANSFHDLEVQFLDHKIWTRGEIERLSQETEELKRSHAVLADQMKACLNAANRGANLAVENGQAIVAIRTDVANQLAEQTTEILKLISTDAIHDQRLAKFEEHLKATADKTVKEVTNKITEQAQKAGQTITTQANKAGRGLSRKVTIPVSLIALVFAFVQWLITNWHKF